MAYLLRCSRVATGRNEVILESGEVYVGSLHTNHLALADPGVEPIHAFLVITEDGGLKVVDLSSDAGLSVNGNKVDGSAKLIVGDTIRIGRTTILVLAPTPTAEAKDGEGTPSIEFELADDPTRRKPLSFWRKEERKKRAAKKESSEKADSFYDPLRQTAVKISQDRPARKKDSKASPTGIGADYPNKFAPPGNTLEVVALWDESIVDFRIYGGPAAIEGEEPRSTRVYLGGPNTDTSLVGMPDERILIAEVVDRTVRLDLPVNMFARVWRGEKFASFVGPAHLTISRSDIAVLKGGPFTYWFTHVNLPYPKLRQFEELDGRPVVLWYGVALYIILSLLIILTPKPKEMILGPEKAWTEVVKVEATARPTPSPAPTPQPPPEKVKPTPPPATPKPQPAPAAPKKEPKKQPPPPLPPPPPPPPPKKLPNEGQILDKAGHGAIKVPKNMKTSKAPTTVVNEVFDGVLPANEIEAVILAHMSEFKACYERYAMAKAPTWSVLTFFVINTNGTVKEGSIKAAQPRIQPAEACMVGVLRGLQFPPPKGGLARITYPFVFSPPVDKQVAQKLDFLTKAKPVMGFSNVPSKSGVYADKVSEKFAHSLTSQTQLSKDATAIDINASPIQTKSQKGVPAAFGKPGGKGLNKVVGKVSLHGSPGGGGLGKPGIEISGPGALTDAEIEAALAKHQQRFQYCYEKALLSNPGLAGNLTMTWSVSPAGDASGARVVSSQMNSNELHSCIAREVNQVKFPKPRGGMVQVKYPFVFASSAL